MAENITAHMDKSLESLKHNFSKVRTGRANANILSDITVDYYGVPTPVTQVAAVKTPEAHMLLIEPWDKALINAIVKARDACFAYAEKAKNLPVPVHLRDTSYKGASSKLGAGKGYKYAHDYPGHWVRQQYLPDDALDLRFYEPSEMGFEARIRQTRKEREGKE